MAQIKNPKYFCLQVQKAVEELAKGKHSHLIHVLAHLLAVHLKGKNVKLSRPL